MRKPPADATEKCIVKMRTGAGPGTRRMALDRETCEIIKPGELIGCGLSACAYTRRGYPKQIVKFDWREGDLAIAQDPKLRGLVPRVRKIVKIARPPIDRLSGGYEDADDFFAVVVTRATKLTEDETDYLRLFTDYVNNKDARDLLPTIREKAPAVCENVNRKYGTPEACNRIVGEWMTLMERIEAAGYYPGDLHAANVARVGGKLVAIDVGEFARKNGGDRASYTARARKPQKGRSLNRFRRT